jgi:hypothetical protein
MRGPRRARDKRRKRDQAADGRTSLREPTASIQFWRSGGRHFACGIAVDGRPPDQQRRARSPLEVLKQGFDV